MDRPTVIRELDDLIVQFDTPFDNFGQAQRALKKGLFWEDMHVTRSAVDGFWYVVDPNEKRVYRITDYHLRKWQPLIETGVASFPRASDDLEVFLHEGHFQFLQPQDTVIA